MARNVLTVEPGRKLQTLALGQCVLSETIGSKYLSKGPCLNIVSTCRSCIQIEWSIYSRPCRGRVSAARN